jgi:hypothetical protein
MILIGLKNILRRPAVSVPTTKIPFDNIVKFGQQTMLEKKLFNVSWILSRFCNYDCSYCWPYAHSKLADHRPLEQYQQTIEEIKKQARANGFHDFHFSFSGGEPTAYKHFLELIEYYSKDTISNYQSIHMTTNLSPGMKWWQRWLDTTKNLSRRSITASFHHEFANEQEFGDKILMLTDHDVFVTINQVMVPELFEDLYARCKRFHKRGINVTLKPQSDPTASFIVDGYTAEQKELLQQGFPQQFPEKYYNNFDSFESNWADRIDNKIYQLKLIDTKHKEHFLDQAERLNAFGFNKFKGWDCNAGYQSCIIREPGGEIKRAYSCKDEPLGTIDTGFNLFKNPAPCITDSCVSSADSKIPKQRKMDFLEHWESEDAVMEISRKQSKQFKKERQNV